MFCSKCGNKLDDDALFCNKCGAKVHEDTAQASDEVVETKSVGASEAKVEEPKVVQTPPVEKIERPTVNASTAQTGSNESGSRLSSYITGKTVLAAIVAVIVIVVLGLGMKLGKKVNLDKYVTVEFEGYDSMGRANWTFDSTKFEKDYGKKLKLKQGKVKKALKKEGIDIDSEIAKEIFEKHTATELLVDSISGSLDQYNKLSNGDKVTFTWNMSDDDDLDFFNYKIKYSKELKFKVKDLEKISSFDPFDGVEVSYSGIAPNGSAEVKQKNKSGVYGDLNYYVEDGYNLSNGDEIVVTCSYGWEDDLADYTAENYGVIPTETEKTFVVEGLSEYVSKIDAISDSALKSMISQGEDVIKSRASNWTEEASIRNVEYVGGYLLYKKSENVYPNNMFTAVFKVDAKVEKEVEDKKDVNDKFSYYYAITYNDIIKLEDGTVSLDVTNYNVSYDSFQKTYDFGGWWETSINFDGYESIDTLFNKCVTSKIETYSYETSIEE